ncbi:hypothetical protein HNR42_002257 [Deinobacterium chartae]|uniref:N-acetyltransferase domain-containing protein n=1 Tax=Deinobacterium chartae TaxID=521158 RepID=A0A841I4A0_9DEIO|nr:hypothetical protein [Deinobacterium chartae]
MSEFRNNPDLQRYELLEGQEVVGFAEYRPAGSAVMFTHTEIDRRFEGQGLGSTLVRAALEDVRAQGRQVVPMCPFVAAYIGRHRSEYVDLVHPQQRGVFGL